MPKKVKNYLYLRSRVFHEKYGVGEVVNLSTPLVGVRFDGERRPLVRYINKRDLKKLVVTVVR